MQKHVTSLELSKKLKTAGVPQESEFVWATLADKNMLMIDTEEGMVAVTKDIQVEPKYQIYYSAFLASELLEMLPREIPVHTKIGAAKFKLDFMPDGECRTAYWMDYKDAAMELKAMKINKVPEQALGEMVLWCVENGHLNFKK